MPRYPKAHERRLIQIHASIRLLKSERCFHVQWDFRPSPAPQTHLTAWLMAPYRRPPLGKRHENPVHWGFSLSIVSPSRATFLWCRRPTPDFPHYPATSTLFRSRVLLPIAVSALRWLWEECLAKVACFQVPARPFVIILGGVVTPGPDFVGFWSQRSSLRPSAVLCTASSPWN